MLLNFSVRNFRSFGEEQTLNMFANPKETSHDSHLVDIPQLKQKALRLGIIYGPNAGGKSSLVKAMIFAKRFLLGEMLLATLGYQSHIYQKSMKYTSFEFTFLSSLNVYTFGFDATSKDVVSEWLSTYDKHGKEILIYERTGEQINTGKLKSLGERSHSLDKAIAAYQTLGLKADQLLLTKLIDVPERHASPIIFEVSHWFIYTLNLVQPESDYLPMVNHIDEDASFREFCSDFLNHVGTGISAIEVMKKTLDVDKGPIEVKQLASKKMSADDQVMLARNGEVLQLHESDPSKYVRKVLLTKHTVAKKEHTLLFAFESDGTRRCLNLLPIFASPSDQPVVFIVDEFDRSLHPHMSRELVKVFAEATKAHQNQLIVTTHETNLLDQDLIRRDEVWFAEKNLDQQTRLTSLSEYSVRNDLRLDKGYLQGRFGGIPFIGDSTRLQEFLNTSPITKVKKRAKKKAKPQA